MTEKTIWRVTLREFPDSPPVYTEDPEHADPYRKSSVPYDVIRYVPGPDPESSSGVGEAVRHHLELAIEAKDRQASDDRIRAALSMLDHFAPVPQSGPVVEGEPPLPVPSEELLRAQAIEDYLADARIPRPFPATQPEPSQETKGERR